MRKFLLLSCLLAVLTPGFAQKSKPKSGAKTPATSTFELADALAKKLISIQVVGIGGHEGESLKLRCKNLRGQLLRVRIPQGLLMEPADSSMQTLVLAEAHSLAVNTRMPAEILLKTFCTQAGDGSPSSGTVFSVGAMAPDKLCQLLKFMSSNSKLDVQGAQAAVWCVTNGQSLASIGDEALTQFTADLLGKKKPGYRVQYESREVPGERAALGKAMIVESSFQYTLAKEEKLSTLLLDATGKTVKVLRDNEVAIAGEHRSGLRLQAWNLTPGKYTVRVQTKGGRVLQDIEVEF
ncbi:MAG: hypothetical protein IT260_09035 [Saprospiraceae bacterium]|nr:hypothetical protein [Saprospiraceae bacterium]